MATLLSLLALNSLDKWNGFVTELRNQTLLVTAIFDNDGDRSDHDDAETSSDSPMTEISDALKGGKLFDRTFLSLKFRIRLILWVIICLTLYDVMVELSTYDQREQSGTIEGVGDDYADFIMDVPQIDFDATTDISMDVKSVLQKVTTDGNLSLRVAEGLLLEAKDRVCLRRAYLKSLGVDVEGIPHESYDFRSIEGKCCENTLGFIQVPVGFVGPIKMNNKLWYVPLATTEGALIASASRGCKVLSETPNGIQCTVVSDFMSRGPVLKASCLAEATKVKQWIESKEGRCALEKAFTSTSRYARLLATRVTLSAGCYIFAKFMASTGDAMGMNMVSKGCEKCIECLQNQFPDLQLVSLSGNYCVDKKASSSNWIDGRGKSVIAEAVIDASAVRSRLKVEPTDLVKLNLIKNFMGSALAASQAGASCFTLE
ncbi:hypothetical protein ACOME3_008935 [Neoechinorhynchus agilis]